MRTGPAAAAGIWVAILAYFVWWGAVHPVWEGDSLAYHIPIAGMVSEGSWMQRESYEKPWYFYPAMGEVLLSGWTAVGMPANWYNVAGWVILTMAVYGLGRRMGLTGEGAAVAAGAAALWPSIVRLIPTQTVDIWTAVWWTAAALTVSGKGKRNDMIWTGIFLGMLIGTKYSGLPMAAALVFGFWKRMKENMWQWTVPMILTGGFWYARNWILTGNPVYPLEVGMLGWRGLPELVIFTGKPILTLFSPGGWILMAEALVSEYLVWSLLLLLPLAVRNKWTWLGLVNFGIYLLLPSRPENILSDLRYIYPAMIPLLLACWKKAQEIKTEEVLAGGAILMMAMEMTQLEYHPKLFAPVAAGVMGALWLTLRITKSKSPISNNQI